MLKISRREFLGIVGTTALFTMFGCNNDTEKKKHEMISRLALQSYDVVDSDEGVMIIRYEYGARVFTVDKLVNINGSLENVEIFYRSVISPEENFADFIDRYNITSMEPAENVFVSLYGLKDYYTIDEVDGVTNEKSYQKIKQKTSI